MGTIVIFFDPDYVFDRVQSAIYGPMHQMAFALAVGWVIMVCVTDNASRFHLNRSTINIGALIGR